MLAGSFARWNRNDKTIVSATGRLESSKLSSDTGSTYFRALSYSQSRRTFNSARKAHIKRTARNVYKINTAYAIFFTRNKFESSRNLYAKGTFHLYIFK